MITRGTLQGARGGEYRDIALEGRLWAVVEEQELKAKARQNRQTKT